VCVCGGGVSDISSHAQVQWRPWLPADDAMPPATGQLLGDYVKQGSLRGAALMSLPGLAQGLAFQGWKWWPNSLQAQRLLLLLKDLGGNRLCLLGHDLLQRLTFEEGANISRRRILTAVATELGVPDPVTFFRSKSLHHKILRLAQESSALLASSSSSSSLSLPAPVYRISSTAYPRMGVITVPGVKGAEGVLKAISDIVLAVRRREGLQEPPASGRRRLSRLAAHDSDGVAQLSRG